MEDRPLETLMRFLIWNTIASVSAFIEYYMAHLYEYAKRKTLPKPPQRVPEELVAVNAVLLFSKRIDKLTERTHDCYKPYK